MTQGAVGRALPIRAEATIGQQEGDSKGQAVSRRQVAVPRRFALEPATAIGWGLEDPLSKEKGRRGGGVTSGPLAGGVVVEKPGGHR